MPPDNPFANKKYYNNVLSKNNKKKILIAAHHFSDAPNVYGNFIFNDFYDWVDFLGKKSEDSDYEWYIKFHPMEFDSNKKTSNYFLNKYKNITIINIAHKGTSLKYCNKIFLLKNGKLIKSSLQK